jgi:hypothetical protein
MTHPDLSGRPADDDAPDENDLALLDGLRELFQAGDPMPAGLPERIRFWLALRDLEVEVARLCAEEGQPVPATRGAEQSRTITFDSDSLTIMIRVEANLDGTVRVDGWLAPPQSRTIELRTMAETLIADADDGGRFAFRRVPRGTAQLVARAGQDPEGSGPAVVAPALVLLSAARSGAGPGGASTARLDLRAALHEDGLPK